MSYKFKGLLGAFNTFLAILPPRFLLRCNFGGESTAKRGSCPIMVCPKCAKVEAVLVVLDSKFCKMGLLDW